MSFGPDDRIRISGNSVAGGWTADLPVSAALSSAGVAALWARARIDELQNIERRHSDPDAIKASIVETALTHHLVSKHTSLVAVDKTPARSSDALLKSERVPNLMPYGQNTNAIFGFPATATNAATLRMSGFVLLLAALLLFVMQRTAGCCGVSAVRKRLGYGVMACSALFRVLATGPGRLYSCEGMVGSGTHAARLVSQRERGKAGLRPGRGRIPGRWRG